MSDLTITIPADQVPAAIEAFTTLGGYYDETQQSGEEFLVQCIQQYVGQQIETAKRIPRPPVPTE